MALSGPCCGDVVLVSVMVCPVVRGGGWRVPLRPMPVPRRDVTTTMPGAA
jgi:hypothetical protein